MTLSSQVGSRATSEVSLDFVPIVSKAQGGSEQANAANAYVIIKENEIEGISNGSLSFSQMKGVNSFYQSDDHSYHFQGPLGRIKDALKNVSYVSSNDIGTRFDVNVTSPSGEYSDSLSVVYQQVSDDIETSQTTSAGVSQIGVLSEANTDLSDFGGSGLSFEDVGIVFPDNDEGPGVLGLLEDIVTAEDDDSTTLEDTSVVIDVLGNDHDSLGHELTIHSFDGRTQQGGTVRLIEMNGVQKLEYTPAENFHGNDRFNYAATDDNGLATAVVNITVRADNDPIIPVEPSPFTFSLLEIGSSVPVGDPSILGNSFDISSFFEDVDGDDIKYSIADESIQVRWLKDFRAPEAKQLVRDVANGVRSIEDVTMDEILDSPASLDDIRALARVEGDIKWLDELGTNVLDGSLDNLTPTGLVITRDKSALDFFIVQGKYPPISEELREQIIEQLGVRFTITASDGRSEASVNVILNISNTNQGFGSGTTVTGGASAPASAEDPDSEPDPEPEPPVTSQDIQPSGIAVPFANFSSEFLFSQKIISAEKKSANGADISLNEDGTLSYKSGALNAGIDRVSFTISDGIIQTEQTIQVLAIENPDGNEQQDVGRGVETLIDVFLNDRNDFPGSDFSLVRFDGVSREGISISQSGQNPNVLVYEPPIGRVGFLDQFTYTYLQDGQEFTSVVFVSVVENLAGSQFIFGSHVSLDGDITISDGLVDLDLNDSIVNPGFLTFNVSTAAFRDQDLQILPDGSPENPFEVITFTAILVDSQGNEIVIPTPLGALADDWITMEPQDFDTVLAFKVTLTNQRADDYSISITAEDSQGEQAIVAFDLEIDAPIPNVIPVLNVDDATVSQIQLLDDLQSSLILENVTLTDQDLISKVVVTLENSVAGDRLEVVESSGITASLQSRGSQLTLTGDATTTQYQDVLRSLQLTHDTNNPGPGLDTRNISVQVTDERGGVTTEQMTVTVTDELPVLSVGNSVNVFVDGAGLDHVIAPSLSISDVDDPAISGVLIQLTGLTGDHLNLDTRLLARTNIKITSQTDNEIRLDGVADLSVYEGILRQISLGNSDTVVPGGLRQIDVTVFDRDSLDASNVSSFTVDVNNNPALDPNTDPEVTGNDVSVSQVQLLDAAQLSEITKTLSLSDVDGDEITQVVVELINPVGIDELSVTLSGNITLDGASTTTTLILTGNASALEYQHVLRTLDLQHANNEPGPGLDSRTLQFEVSDAKGGHTAETLTVAVTNEAPVLSGCVDANTFADVLRTGHVIAPNLSVSDVDDPSVSGALIQLKGFSGDSLILDASVLTGTGITALSQTANEIRLDGVADLVVYEGVLRQISVLNDSSAVPGGSRQVDFTVFDRDSSDVSNISSVTIDVNNHPVFDPNTDVGVDGNDINVSQVQLLDAAQLSDITKTLSLSDIDGDEITQVVVELINPVGIDELSVTLSGNITLDGASTATTLILTGNASALEYQHVLRTLDLQHDNNEPGPGLDSRTLQFEVSDARGGNATDTLTVSVTNEVPVLSSDSNANIFVDALSSGHVIAPNLSVSDVDDPSVSGALIQLTGFSGDSLILDANILAGTGITALSQTANEIRLDGVVDLSVYEGVLRQISVSNDLSAIPGGSRQVDFTVFDRDSNDASNVASVTIDVNNHPVFDPNTDVGVDGNDVNISQVQLLDAA